MIRYVGRELGVGNITGPKGHNLKSMVYCVENNGQGDWGTDLEILPC